MELTKHEFCHLQGNLSSESGHTVVEILVALAILAIAVVPASQLISRVLMSGSTRDLITATRLAQGEIERGLLEPDITDSEKRMVLNGKPWRVRRVVTSEDGLIRISTRAFKKNSRIPLVFLTTLRLSE